MIHFENIEKSFSGKKILKGVSGTFKQGVVNLIIGASGTGKSLLIKCIMGLIDPDNGKIFFDEHEISKTDKKIMSYLRQNTGMLFQGGALFDSINVEENIMFPLNILTTMPYKEKLDKVNYCLEKVDLPGIGNKMVSELSGGMKKRVGIARAIINNPKYLLFDEPNSGLDPQTSLMIDELIKEITYEYNTTSVVVTHDINSMLTIGDHIIFLYKGEKTWEGTKKDIFNTKSESFNEFFFSNEFAKLLKKKLNK